MRGSIGWWLIVGAACRSDEPTDTGGTDGDTHPTHPGDADADTDADADADADADTDSDADADGERRYDCSGLDPADPAPLGGWVALTFDDGPDVEDTPVILEILRDRGIPATFMMLGEQVSDPAAWPLVEEIAADPLFDIGNHTWDHADLATLSLSDVEAEIDDTTDLLATFDVDPTFFRFPYGDSTCATHDLATDRGFRVAGWHIDTADWCYAAGGGVCTTDDYWRVPPEYETDMIGLSMEQIHRFDGGIVLFHDIHTFTADHLEAFVDGLLDEGYRFAALDDAAVWPNLVAGTPADLPYLGERCDTAHDDCWQVEHAAWCEPANPDDPGSTDGICTLPCEGTCLDRDGAAVTFCADVAAGSGGAGQCVGRAASQNGDCADLPGTVLREMDRFVGSSGASPATAEVCASRAW
ncbi:MAG: polysaccharide deacetylase family protein [Myxococcota bacterium]